MTLRLSSVVILALLSCGAVPTDEIPVVLGGSESSRQTAYLWSEGGHIFTATGKLWAEECGTGLAYLPVGRRIRSIDIFASTDRGSCYEGYVQILDYLGNPVALRAPHKEVPFQNYDAWTHRDVQVSTDQPLTVRWLCRVGCARYDPETDQRVEPDDFSARCHYAVQFEIG